jgi:cysteine desulfurase
LDKARQQIARLIHASDPSEIIFTSCGTEAINTALESALATQPHKSHIVTTAVEHSATLKYCRYLQSQGISVTYLPVERDGSVDIHELEQSIRADTALVSVMWANNETGVIFPIEEIAAICRSKHVLFHTDAVQTPGKVRLDVQSTGVDMLSLSAHKLHAPKGVGMLYVRKGVPFQPMIIGGQQERGRRGGTENVPYIIGFGRAADLATEFLQEENTRVRKLRDTLEEGILSRVRGSFRNGNKHERLPNTSNICFGNSVEAEAILLMLDRAGICASSGSACTSGSMQPSHVLTAMGLRAEDARSSIRFSVGRYNTADEVDYALQVLPEIINTLTAAGGTGAAEQGSDGKLVSAV